MFHEGDTVPRSGNRSHPSPPYLSMCTSTTLLSATSGQIHRDLPRSLECWEQYLGSWTHSAYTYTWVGKYFQDHVLPTKSPFLGAFLRSCPSYGLIYVLCPIPIPPYLPNIPCQGYNPRFSEDLGPKALSLDRQSHSLIFPEFIPKSGLTVMRVWEVKDPCPTVHLETLWWQSQGGEGYGEGTQILLTLHSQPIWYLWFRLFFWVVLSVSQGTMKSQRVMCILPSPSAFPVGESPGSVWGSHLLLLPSSCIWVQLWV